MTSRYRSRTKVFDSNIAGLFREGGEVMDEVKASTREVKDLAQATAPSRSGELRLKHRRSVVPSGIYGVRGYVENTAFHAPFVHEGTTGPIVAKSGRLRMRPAPHSLFPGPTLHYSVAGQSANPWLREAANQVMLRRYRTPVT